MGEDTKKLSIFAKELLDSEDNMYDLIHSEKYYNKLIYDKVYIDIHPILDK